MQHPVAKPGDVAAGPRLSLQSDSQPAATGVSDQNEKKALADELANRGVQQMLTAGVNR